MRPVCISNRRGQPPVLVSYDPFKATFAVNRSAQISKPCSYRVSSSPVSKLCISLIMRLSCAVCAFSSAISAYSV